VRFLYSHTVLGGLQTWFTPSKRAVHCDVHDQSIWAQGPCPQVWFRAYNQVHCHIGLITLQQCLKASLWRMRSSYESAQCSTEHLFSTETCLMSNMMADFVYYRFLVGIELRLVLCIIPHSPRCTLYRSAGALPCL